jgi:polyphosphate glucokinase
VKAKSRQAGKHQAGRRKRARVAKMPSTKHSKKVSIKNVLVVDVGGTSVKILATGQTERRSFPSGPTLTPRRMVSEVKKLARGWTYDVVSIGYPGPVLHGRPMAEPYHLGRGWLGFDFAEAFGHPVKVANDAAMQALGSYQGGKMLFLGLGTGLGSTMIVDGIVEPMELSHLPYKKATYEDYVGNNPGEISPVSTLSRGGLQLDNPRFSGAGRASAVARRPARLRGISRWLA